MTNDRPAAPSAREWWIDEEHECNVAPLRETDVHVIEYDYHIQELNAALEAKNLYLKMNFESAAKYAALAEKAEKLVAAMRRYVDNPDWGLVTLEEALKEWDEVTESKANREEK